VHNVFVIFRVSVRQKENVDLYMSPSEERKEWKGKQWSMCYATGQEPVFKKKG
jgi:hypothetical protein